MYYNIIMENEKIILSGMTLAEMEAFTANIGESKYRAKQIHNWIYKKSVFEFEQMTDLSKKTRELLQEKAVVTQVAIKKRQISKDGTIKYLLQYPDGECVETVLMRFDNRANLTACVSSQIGCAVGCDFCATGKRGFIRNLTKNEIVEQILTIQRDTGLRVTNVVYMGQGEPLLNLDNVFASIDILNFEMEIGIRRITVSTSGILPNIRKIGEYNRQLTLAFSMHAPNSQIRRQIMSIDNKYPLKEVLSELKKLTQDTGRRFTIEYILIKDLNDRPEHAKEINYLIKDMNCNINLIPYNPVTDDKYQKSSLESINMFKYILEQSGKKATVRLERGADIDAACGQLSGKVAQ